MTAYYGLTHTQAHARSYILKVNKHTHLSTIINTPPHMYTHIQDTSHLVTFWPLIWYFLTLGVPILPHILLTNTRTHARTADTAVISVYGNVREDPPLSAVELYRLRLDSGKTLTLTATFREIKRRSQ